MFVRTRRRTERPELARNRQALYGLSEVAGFLTDPRGNAPMATPTNPFVVLSYVGGPALLTNATSLLVLSTANRFARAVDRSRYLTGLLAQPALEGLHVLEVAELRTTGQRIRLIGTAISALYLAAAMFALATVVSILGGVLAQMTSGTALDVIIVFAVALGVVGFAAFVTASLALVIETRITLRWLGHESANAIAAMEQALPRKAGSDATGAVRR